MYQLGSEGIKPLSGSLLPPGRLLVAVEERPVLGEDQSGRIAVGRELDGRQRYGHEVLPNRKGRGVCDSLAKHDVVVLRLEGKDLTVLVVATVDFSATDAEVELVRAVGGNQRALATGSTQAANTLAVDFSSVRS